MIRLFHDGMTGQVLSSGNVTEAFAISNGVKQGCVLAPVLFNLFFTCMLSHAVQDLEKGVYIRYRLDGSLFDLEEVLFADDCALVAHAEPDVQMMLDRFSEASKLFGLTISLGKMEVLQHPAPNTYHLYPVLPSMTHDLPMLNISNTWEAPFPVMAPWTKRSPLELARLARHWADFAPECSTNTVSGYQRN